MSKQDYSRLDEILGELVFDKISYSGDPPEYLEKIIKETKQAIIQHLESKLIEARR